MVMRTIVVLMLANVVTGIGIVLWVTNLPPEQLQPADPTGVYGFLYQELALIAATLLGTLTFVVCWLAVGRSPKGGDISLEFEPPNGIGPAALRYVHTRCFDTLCATAAVLGMAVKGALSIVEERALGSSSRLSFRLEPAGTAGKGLTTAEQATYDALFPSDEPLHLRGSEAHGACTDKARTVLEAELRKEYDGTSFRWNLRYSNAAATVGVTGAFILLLVANQSLGLPFFLSFALTGEQLKQWILALGASAVVTFLYALPWLLPQVPRHSRRDLLGHFGLATVIAAVVLAFAYWLIEGSTASENYIRDWILIGSGAFYGAVITIFYRLMGATTKGGQRLIDRIRGFGLYIEGEEEDPKTRLAQPELTAALFERYLPYAAALDLTNDWSGQFAGTIKPTWTPGWYRSNSPFAADQLVKSLDSAIAATSEHAAAARKWRRRFIPRLGGAQLQPGQ